MTACRKKIITKTIPRQNRRKPKSPFPANRSPTAQRRLLETRNKINPVGKVGRATRNQLLDFSADQFRKPAVIANRVRVPAKITDNLHQALLRRCSFQNFRVGSSKQTLSRQFQNRIVLRSRPREKSPFDFAPNFFIAAFDGTNPKPRQNHIDRQIRHARLAQKRLRLFHPRRFERPVPRPKFVAPGLQNVEQRI